MNMEKWAKTREKGKQHFVLVNGVLGWGVPTAILWSTLMEFLEPSENIWVRPIIALIIFPIAGIAFGYFTWNKSEKTFEKESTKNI
ncbi:hypothetical protein ACD631_09755 [Alteromonas macleodii]|uniref:hypothetical protein n=1 Tax=Alteromonas macleodii TaxID=28108 RepID=UPI0020769499|nr:hypothetical protein [Alteromonas macleodii]USI26665.1 hypothetical protein NFG60_13195 [Alteromonas macleodii]